MKVLITGGAGFIGTNLTLRLRRNGIDVVVLDDLSSGKSENVKATDARFVYGSILDSALLSTTLPGMDAVVHLAARPSVPLSLTGPVESHDVNATGTIQVLEGCRQYGVPYVIVASSSSVYGANPVLPKSEDLTPMPMSPYAVSKLAAESYASVYLECFGLKTIAFRFFNVYGPYQHADHKYAAVVPAFVDAALSDRPLIVYGDGMQSRDFTHVDDVTNVISRALTNSITSRRPVNLAFGTRTSLLELGKTVEDLINKSLSYEHREPRIGDVTYSQADNSQLLRLIPGLEAINLRDGLETTLNWARRQRGEG